MKSTAFSYLIFVDDVNTPLHKESTSLHGDHGFSLQAFLNGYANCFIETNYVEFESLDF